METLAALIVLFFAVLLLALPILGAVLGTLSALRVQALSRRIDGLERALAEAAGPGTTAPNPQPQPILEPAIAAARPASEPPRASRPPPLVAAESAAPRRSRTLPSADRFAVWLASALGGLLVLLGSLFALAVAIDKGWFVPSLRVAAGLVGGTALWLAAAGFRHRRFAWLSSALSGAGMGVLYATLYAAAGRYHLLGQVPAFALMSAVTAMSMAISVRHRDRFMAWLGLLGGLLTPVLLTTGANDALGLFTYLVLLASGAVLAGWRRGWPELVVAAALGSGLLHLGWTSSWHAPDQVPAAVLAALALTIPFAVAAGRGATHDGARSDSTLGDRSAWVTAAAFVGAIGLPLLSLPWLVPLDPLFTDPRTGLGAVRALGDAPLWAAAALAVLPAPAWLAARRRAWPVAGLATSAAASLLLLAFAAGWSHHGEPPMALIAAALLAPLVAATLSGAGCRGAGWSLLPLPVVTGLAVAVFVAVAEPPGEVVFALGTGLVLASLLSAAGTGRTAQLASGLLGTTIALVGAASALDGPDLQWIGAPLVLAYAAFSTLPMRRLLAPGGGALDAATAALAGPLLFVGLHASWVASWGDAVVGLLPLSLGAVALLGAALLVRVMKVDRGDPSLALFVAVALAGATTALPLQLHSQWLTVAWALEAAALAALSRRLTHPLIRTTSVLLAATVSARLLLDPGALSWGDAGGLPVLNWTLYTWGVPAACLMLAAHWLDLKESGDSALARLDSRLPTLLRVLAVLVVFALVNVEVSHAFLDAGPLELSDHGLVPGMVRSLAWAAYGILVLGVSLRSNSRWGRLIGFGIVLCATAKVFAVDLWSLSGFARVGSAFGLGVSLLLAAFLFERLVLRRSAAPLEST